MGNVSGSATALTNRNGKIQIMRAIAIIAVVIIHTCPSGMWQVFVRPFVNFAVALFLFLSGYLTKVPVQDMKSFASKRIVKVLIPYVIWTVIYSVAHRHPDRILFNLITTRAAGPFYYIFVYIQFVLLTPLLGKLAASKWQWVGWLIMPVSTVIFTYIPLLTGMKWHSYVTLVWDVSCLCWFSYYYLGLILKNQTSQRTCKTSWLGIAYVLSLLLQMGEGLYWNGLGSSNAGSQTKLTVFISATLFLLLAYQYLKNQRFEGKSKVLRYVGDCSFGIYLSHMLVIGVLEKLPFYDKIPFGVNSLLVVVVCCVCVAIGRKICGPKISGWLGLN